MARTNLNTVASTVTAAKVDAPTFTAANYAVAASAMVKACNDVDKANAKAGTHIALWAVTSAIGIKVNALTLDTVKAQLIASTTPAMRKANVLASGRDIAVDSLEACGNTVKGNFYAFQRIAKGGALDRLIAGEAFNTVARDAKPVQEQKAKGKGTGKGTGAPANDATPLATGPVEVAASAPITVQSLAAPLIAHLDGLSLKAIKANENDIAAIIACMGRLNAKLAAATKASAKPARKATVKDAASAPRAAMKPIAVAA